METKKFFGLINSLSQEFPQHNSLIDPKKDVLPVLKALSHIDALFHYPQQSYLPVPDMFIETQLQAIARYGLLT